MNRRSDGRASNGGARPGAGRLPTSIPISGPGVIYLRELTRARLGRQEVTRDEMGATMEELFKEWARQQPDGLPPEEAENARA